MEYYNWDPLPATSVFELLYITAATSLFAVPQLYSRWEAGPDWVYLLLWTMLLCRISSHQLYQRLTTVILPLAHVGLTGNTRVPQDHGKSKT